MILQINLDQFPELIEIEKWLKDNNHNFLRSIYNNSMRYKLSPNQIAAGKKSLE